MNFIKVVNVDTEQTELSIKHCYQNYGNCQQNPAIGEKTQENTAMKSMGSKQGREHCYQKYVKEIVKRTLLS